MCCQGGGGVGVEDFSLHDVLQKKCDPHIDVGQFSCKKRFFGGAPH